MAFITENRPSTEKIMPFNISPFPLEPHLIELKPKIIDFELHLIEFQSEFA